MTKLVRWTPFRTSVNMFDEFDRLFDSALPNTIASREWGVAVDVVENGDGYTVKATVPGIDVNDLEITLEDNVLTLKGEMKADEISEDSQYHVRERRFGSFSRRVRFPVLVNSDAVEASYENGILTLTVPKAEEVKPRRIEIKAS